MGFASLYPSYKNKKPDATIASGFLSCGETSAYFRFAIST